MTTDASPSIEIDLPSISNDTQTGSSSIESCFSAAAISSPIHNRYQTDHDLIDSQPDITGSGIEGRTEHKYSAFGPSHTLRTSQSFRLDEGYSEEAIGVEDLHTNNFGEIALENLEQIAQRIQSTRSQAGDIELPAWMMALNDDLRRG